MFTIVTTRGSHVTLIDRLEHKRLQEGWSARELADELGISHSTWSLIRRGHRKPGRRFLQAVIRRFPRLDDDLLVYIRDDDAPFLTGSVADGHPPVAIGNQGGS
jgi:transcriptional regulator with XRE-family HTH domain